MPLSDTSDLNSLRSRSLERRETEVVEGVGDPTEKRMHELERKETALATRVIRGQMEILQILSSFLRNAASNGPDSYAYGIADKAATQRSESLVPEVMRLTEKNPGFRILHITDIQKENVAVVKKLINAGFEVRHLEGNKIRFSISKEEYIETSHTPILDGVPDQIVWSNDPQLVSQATRIFEVLWEQSLPAESRIEQLEQGIEPPRIDVLRNVDNIENSFLRLIREAKEQIDIVIPTANSFHRHERSGTIRALEKKALQERVQVRILCPFDSAIEHLIKVKPEWSISPLILEKATPTLSIEGSLLFREIDSARTDTKVTILIVDKKKSLTAELRDDSQTSLAHSVGLSTFSNSKSTVTSYAAIFDKLWHETELKQSEANARRDLARALEREAKTRREAQLLQDIISHDIRNYLQVIKLSAELIQELTDAGDPRKESLASIENASEGSIRLLEKARKLGKVLSEREVKLYPVNLGKSVEDSMNLIKEALKDDGKEVESSLKFEGGVRYHEAYVLGDSLLDEVFANLFSNSIQHAEKNAVVIETIVKEPAVEEIPNIKSGQSFWKISVSDNGRGIEDGVKERLFSRYMDSATGSGLGMSIIHALVVERYGGRIVVKNKVPHDSTQGTTVVIFLPKADLANY
ncbi:MAG: ATP-binding protein [Nitrososphaerales archaeon]